MMRTERNKEELKQQRNKPEIAHIPDSSTDHQDEVKEGNGVSSDLTFVRGTTTQFKEVAHNTEEDEGTKKVSARSLSVSKSGRCKNRNQYRIKMPSEEIYIDSKSDTTMPPSGSTDSPSLSSRKKKDARLERTQKTDLSDSFTFSSQENLTSRVEESSRKLNATPETKQSQSPLSPSSPAAKRSTNSNLSTLKSSSSNKSKDKTNVGKEATKQSSDEASKTIKNSSEKCAQNNVEDKTKPVVADKKKSDSKQRKEKDTKKENRKSNSSRFHIGSDGLCKLSIHNETASLAVVESTDL